MFLQTLDAKFDFTQQIKMDGICFIIDEDGDRMPGGIGYPPPSPFSRRVERGKRADITIPGLTIYIYIYIYISS